MKVSVVTLLLLALASPAQVAVDTGGARVIVSDTALDRRTKEVASGLRCPVCQGLSIYDSPADLAVEMKGLVREQLAAGKSPDEVRAYFIEKYGEWVLLAPRARGFNLLVYLLPLALVLAGGWLVWGFVRRHIPAGPTTE